MTTDNNDVITPGGPRPRDSVRGVQPGSVGAPDRGGHLCGRGRSGHGVRPHPRGPEVRQRGPHHRPAVPGEDVEVRGRERRAVNADQVVGDGPPPVRKVQRLEMLACGGVGAFRQMQDQLLGARYSCEKAVGVSGVHVRDVGLGSGKTGVAGRFHIPDESTEVADDPPNPMPGPRLGWWWSRRAGI